MVVSPFFPMIFNTTAPIKRLATYLILLNGIFMPFQSFIHASYFVIRSGGNTLITVLFDCVFVWIISVPAAYIMSRYTSLSVVWMVGIIMSVDLLKALVGAILVKSNIWAKDITRK